MKKFIAIFLVSFFLIGCGAAEKKVAQYENKDGLGIISTTFETAIDDWLEENEDTLNEYGDPIDTPIPREEDMFDKSINRKINRHEYIIKKHQDMISVWSASVNEGRE